MIPLPILRRVHFAGNYNQFKRTLYAGLDFLPDEHDPPIKRESGIKLLAFSFLADDEQLVCHGLPLPWPRKVPRRLFNVRKGLTSLVQLDFAD